jgi:peptidoglycan hydrolase CwlO-like protein
VVATSREQVNRHLAVAREKAESAERALAILSQILSSAASSDLPAPSSFSTSRAGSPTSNTHIDTMPDTASDVGTAPLNGQHSPSNGNRVSTERDDDEQQELIRSLRAQMGDLATQVSQLNSKLVTSYNRISDLEDELHDTTSSLTTFRNRASDLEGKLVQHEALLQTGTLVSRNEIASELQRLMEAAAEAALDKGRAEEARESIERDLSDLSESLFGEAGRMVRDARKEMAEQERRMGEMEKEVKESERMVSMLLGQLRTFRENGTAGAELSPSSFAATRRMSERHLRRFNDKNASFLAFEALLKHIAFLKLSAPSMAHPPPALPALLNTTFISKLVVEDSYVTLHCMQPLLTLSSAIQPSVSTPHHR